MDFDTIRAHFEWFHAEAQSWSELTDQARALCAQLDCISITRDQPIFEPVYAAYDNIHWRFTSGTDGISGVGFGVAAQLSAQVPDLLKRTAAAYATAAAEDAEALNRVKTLIEEW